MSTTDLQIEEMIGDRMMDDIEREENKGDLQQLS